MRLSTPTKVVFDVGNVLVRWQPEVLYRSMCRNDEEVRWLLDNVHTHEWNLELDRGRDWDEAFGELAGQFPEWENQIRGYQRRWSESLNEPIVESVAVLRRLRAAGVATYAITNFAGPAFRQTQERHVFLTEFDGIIVSGEEKLVKPDREIFDLFLARHDLSAEDCVFIDDNAANIKTAKEIGMSGIHFIEPIDLAANLRGYGFSML